jgi:hypothetical protein
VKRFVVALLAALVCLAQAEELYKWVDENGVVHYDTQAPEGKSVTSLELENPNPYPDPSDNVYSQAIEVQKQRNEAKALERDQDRLAREEEQKSKLLSDKSCGRAIHYVAILQKQCPVFYDGAGFLRDQCPGIYYAYAGERSYIDDDERQRLLDHYLKIVVLCRENRD